MEIKGKVHCFFEQSGTFKNEFKKLGYEAYDYDIQNNFGETDFQIDLFKEIEGGYKNENSIFDDMTKDDLIIAFFPCIYFESFSMMNMSITATNYRKLTPSQAMDKVIERASNRYVFYNLLLKFVKVVIDRGLRMIFENPWAQQHYLKQGNFPKQPSYIDPNRTRRGDVFVKPTAYWFFNCEPTEGFTRQQTPKHLIRNIINSRGSKQAGICSEERSMISPDYARNFICDQILGLRQQIAGVQPTLF